MVNPSKLQQVVSETNVPASGRELDKMERAKPRSPLKSESSRPLRIAIVTENFLPKVDGVTRTLARLLEHLQAEGHEALVCGPESGMTSYAGHQVIGTKGIPLLGVYKGLKLNFLRPAFIQRIAAFQPDVIQFVDPIWLCAQTIPVIQYWMPTVPLLTSYHTNLAMYATLFGFSWLTPTIWNLQRNLHSRCALTYCPSPSTARMLTSQGFSNVRLWPRGVDTGLFRPTARDYDLRRSWGAEAPLQAVAEDAPPSYSTLEQDKIVMLYVGRISWEKNLRLLVEAFRGLQVADVGRRACKLVFVGDGPSRPELEQLCASYNLDAVFMGYRKGDELAACYASADIFAFPSWTETFGQVVLESLASGLPVVGLRAEGVVDLVKHEETGLLFDLDDLVPTTTAATVHAEPESLDDFKPLPANPHALVDVNSPTFPLAVSIYRSLLIDLATHDNRRAEMGRRAAEDASSRSWHGAMEMIVDGYREISLPAPPSPAISALSLSRTSTLEIEVVSLSPGQETYAESTASTRGKRRRLLQLGGVLRRSGGRLADGSMSISGNFWRTRAVASLEGEDGGVLVKPLLVGHSNHIWAASWAIKSIFISYLLYLALLWISQDIRVALAPLIST